MRTTKVGWMHMMIHTREKPSECSYCDKSFGWKAHLKIHQRTHIDEKWAREWERQIEIKREQDRDS